ncbi:hypothetical protein F4776DRAFT_393683 [Hypoxylon sp. NC0597]|nr:hypothetical protein F4776DRAFT_393683 [Hypoxylon sp. NC0597]
MAGILGSYSDSTCNTHNALRNISAYACGVTFSFKDPENPPDMHYAVVSLQKCCDKVNSPVFRIPGNTGCEMQFCDVPVVTSSYTSTIYVAPTGSGTATQTPVPTVTEGTEIGWSEEVDNCVRFVYEGDLPDDIAKEIYDVGGWCVVRMYDDELPPSEVSAAVTASPAPPSWTSAAVDPWDLALSSARAASASAAANPTPTNNGCSRYADQKTANGVRIWAVVALMTIGIVAAF